MAIRLLTVGFSEIYQTGLYHLFKNTDDFEILGQCRNCHELRIALKRSIPNIILMNIGGDSNEYFKVLKCISQYKELKILILSSEYFVDLDELYNKFRVVGYLNIQIDYETLKKEIYFAQNGGTIYNEKIFSENDIFKRNIKTPRLNLDLEPYLTPQEIKILTFLDKGLTNNEIANELYISEYTVKAHIRNILSKLSTSSRQKAVYVAKSRGLLN
jgi:NarL family two-component system response regulator YdfI